MNQLKFFQDITTLKRQYYNLYTRTHLRLSREAYIYKPYRLL